MPPEEYIQLKAYARIDGAIIGAAWVVSFALCIAGLSNPPLSMLGTTIAIVSPIAVAMMLRRFRDVAREGVISFGRAMGYYVMIFLYASLLLAAAQYAYFAFMDNGLIFNYYAETLRSPEMQSLMQASGISKEQLETDLAMLRQIDPLHIVLNVLSMNVVLGLLFALPAAAIVKRKEPKQHVPQG